MSTAAKDTIYIDIDDEITSIIDKVNASSSKIVALVLPKRAAVLQSVVNMRLLKRTADDASKRVVLITSEVGLLPLAGMVGLHVAKTLQSKPAVPDAPKQTDAAINVSSDDIDEVETPIDPSKPVGELAGGEADEAEETIEVGEPETPVEVDGKKPKKAVNRKLKIPNFDKFRLRLFLAALALILLLVGWYVAFWIMPTATVRIKTDSASIDSTLQIVANPKATVLDENAKIVPATTKELKKTETEKVPATGEKDNGTKAVGKVQLKNCTKVDGDITIPAGTGISTSNLTFITDAAAVLPESSFTGGGTCTTTTVEVAVTSQNAGDKYNISENRTFVVAGYSSVTATNDDPMSGGTSKLVKVVSQGDIDGAKQKLLERDNKSASATLLGDLEQAGFVGIPDTMSAGSAVVTSVPALNEEATEVTVSAVTTYTMLGVKKDDLQKLIEKDVESKIDKTKQVILDNGLDDASFSVTEKKPTGEVAANLKVTVQAGPQLDAEAIKREVAGKKRGPAQEQVKSRPGIEEVTVTYKPFWVYSTPKKTQKITVIFESANSDDNAAGDSE